MKDQSNTPQLTGGGNAFVNTVHQYINWIFYLTSAVRQRFSFQSCLLFNRMSQKQIKTYYIEGPHRTNATHMIILQLHVVVATEIPFGYWKLICSWFNNTDNSNCLFCYFINLCLIFMKTKVQHSSQCDYHSFIFSSEVTTVGKTKHSMA